MDVGESSVSNNWPFPRPDIKRERDALITRIMVFKPEARYKQFVDQDLATLNEWLNLARNGHDLPFETSAKPGA